MMSARHQMIHRQATQRTLGQFRTWIFGLWFAAILLAPIQELARLPELAPYCVGILLKYLPLPVKYGLYTSPILWTIKIILLISCLCVIFRKCPKMAGGIFCLVITIYQGMIRGISHVHHSELVLMYAAYIFVMFEFMDPIVQKHRGMGKNGDISLYGLPLTATLAALCFTYTFIGIHRFVYGGLQIFLSDSLIYWIIENSNEPKLFSWPVDHLLIQHAWLRSLLKLGFPVCTVIEILAPFALISHRFRGIFIVVMLGFHLFNWIFMGILFLENMLLFVLFYEPRRKDHTRQPDVSTNIS